jgi:uncharacterized repeat protein (TIGR01451 family)
MKGVTCSLLAFLLAGCVTQQATQQRQPQPPPPAPPPAQPAARNYGPSYATFEQNGQKFIRGSMGFPTGLLESSGLLLEKIVPVEVLVGQPTSYEYRVINLTDYEIREVVVMDQVTSEFKPGDAEPKAESVSGNTAAWRFASLGPKETKVIKVRGTANAEGTIVTCGWATYSPILCEPIKVTKANLQLVKTAPAEVLVCDPIPMKLVVKNTGSSALTQVKVVDTLPDGLTSSGQKTVTFDAGTLTPGQSKEFALTANAARTGKYVNTAKATSAQGVEAQDTATTVVRKPVLTIACEAPDERFIGRPIDVCVKVANTGDAASAGSVVELPVPSGLTFQGATAGGRLADNKVVWDVGSLAPNASKEVCATFTAATSGTMQFAPSARGQCADPVKSACQTRIAGIPAILLEVIDTDDPVEVGKTTTYVIEVTNQGSAPATNVRLVCDLEDSQEYVSGSGDSAVSAAGQRITMAPVASIAPKAKATWRVVVKATKVSNVRFKTSMTSDQLTRPVEETESTNQY